MKYCMKCGTLLEDSHEICIGCGADVTKDGAWSLYPPEMAKQVEIEKKEKKNRGALIAGMVVVFVLLIASIAMFIIMNMNNEGGQTEEVTEEVAEVVEEPVEETTEAVTEDAETEPEEEQSAFGVANISDTEPEEEAPVSSEREVKDSKGKYYKMATLADDAGNEVFSTMYPEDFVEQGKSVRYDVYSTRFPETLTYVVGNEDGNVRMTYVSPQHFWYRKSDGKKSMADGRNIKTYMQFYKYDGAQGYIEAMIKESYSGSIKGFKFIGKDEYSSSASAKIKEVSDKQTNYLLGDIGDYARIASDTVYAAMAAECEAYIYHYEITSKQGNTIYMDVYCPVIANTLGYVTEYENDKGEVVEWVIPEFIAFEAGNEELHDMYADSFDIFIANSRLTEEFFYTNAAFSKEVETAIADKKDLAVNPITLDASKLKTIHSSYKSGADITDYGRGVYELLATAPAESAAFDGDLSIIGSKNSKVAFYSKEKNKVFISTEEDEYPGDDYIELNYHEGVASSETSSDSSDSSDSE